MVEDTPLKMTQVLVLHRHGERVPVRHQTRILGVERLWRQCSIAPFVHALHTVLDTDNDKDAHPTVAPLFPPVIGEIRVIHGDPGDADSKFIAGLKGTNSANEGVCNPGQLTDIGKATMHSFGASLRREYTDNLNFLPQILDPDFIANKLYVRSTGYVRTIESVQYLLAGLFPLHTRPLGKTGDILIHISARENMYIDMGCKRLRQILEPFRAAAKANTAEETARIMKKLESLFPDMGKKETAPVVSSTPGAPAEPLSLAEKRAKQFNFREIDLFYDTFKCMSASSIPFPPGVTSSDMDSLSHIFMESFIGGIADAATPSKSDLKTAHTVRKLLMGRFVGDLLHTMDENIKNPKNGVKLGIFSGHDTTIGPLLVSLGLFEGETRAWPKFASNIAFEVLQDTKRNSNALNAGDEGRYVRVKYNGVAMGLEACKSKGSHYMGDPTLCTYKAFSSAMRTLIPKNYEQECAPI
ncbi:hypothetical protein HDU80_011317 [Chytriomyces hyalinus]|nr:hypothetical protein HDU80_011317 [Chytriomyces hyalinus]